MNLLCLFVGPHYPSQQSIDLPQNNLTNGMQQPPFSPQQQQIMNSHMNHMMGNMQLNNTQPLTNQQGMMQNHPMTFIQQTDSNQNIPLYQQQQR